MPDNAQNEQTAINLTSPNQRTGPKSAECMCRLGSCTHQLTAQGWTGTPANYPAGLPIVCGKRGMTRIFGVGAGDVEYRLCLFACSVQY